MISISTILKHYKRKPIQKKIIKHVQDKEVAVRYHDKFGKRPNVLNYPKDILSFAQKGATSFHASEERWTNPFQLSPSLKRKQLDSLRIGWDLIIDIDCHFLEYSKIAADLIIKFLEYKDIHSYSIKYSGNKGFHIGLPFEAFPQRINNQPTSQLFPEAARKIAFYIAEHIKEPLSQGIMKLEDSSFSQIQKKLDIQDKSEIIRYRRNKFNDLIPALNVDPFLEIDTLLISSRHLYRVPYSLHEKSGLVSIPINPKKVLQFDKKIAQPEKVEVSSVSFIPREANPNEAKSLILQALDFKFPDEKKKTFTPKKDYFQPENAVPKNFFPPCIKKISQGLEDGRKRALFVLIYFLKKMKWPPEKIENYLHDWNEKNHEPLRETYLQTQLRYSKNKDILPPNCDNDAYYKAIAICHPDPLCRKLKNPVNYAFIKMKSQKKPKQPQKNKKPKDL